MRCLRGIGGGHAAITLVVCAALAGCGGSEEPDAPDPGAEPAQSTADAGTESADASVAAPEAGATKQPKQFEPSEFARRELAKPLLRAYLGTGQLLGLDWTVLAAADDFLVQRAGDAGVVVTKERVPGLAYALLAAGAPLNYRRAVGAQVGVENAEKVLGTARRLRK